MIAVDSEHWAQMIAVPNTERGCSRLGPRSEHWARMIAVPVANTGRRRSRLGPRSRTLGADDRGWGPVANTGRRRSRLGSGSGHWAYLIAIEVRWWANTERRYAQMI